MRARFQRTHINQGKLAFLVVFLSDFRGFVTGYFQRVAAFHSKREKWSAPLSQPVRETIEREMGTGTNIAIVTTQARCRIWQPSSP